MILTVKKKTKKGILMLNIEFRVVFKDAVKI